jgi:hypothetical protein
LLACATRLHADACAQLEAVERAQQRALRWRDATLCALLPHAPRVSAPTRDAGDAAAPPCDGGVAEAWLPPAAWPLLPCGSPARLWPQGDDVSLSYAV